MNKKQYNRGRDKYAEKFEICFISDRVEASLVIWTVITNSDEVSHEDSFRFISFVRSGFINID